MLVDPQFKQPDREVVAILAIISGKLLDSDAAPTRLDTGLYLMPHFNANMYVNTSQWEQFWGYKIFGNVAAHDYGVCDSPEQLVAKRAYKKLLSAKRTAYCVFFTPVHREEQPPDDGWRWHKWGIYEGKQKPRHEYLYDDTHIDLVYCFHIFKHKK
jgi:hypothetical protein